MGFFNYILEFKTTCIVFVFLVRSDIIFSRSVYGLFTLKKGRKEEEREGRREESK